jgi:hypothetical protein
MECHFQEGGVGSVCIDIELDGSGLEAESTNAVCLRFDLANAQRQWIGSIEVVTGLVFDDYPHYSRTKEFAAVC